MTTDPLRIAVVGSGIAGLAAAWLLNQRHRVTLYEAADSLGGHTRSVDVTLEGHTRTVDTGFLVYNRNNYPQLSAMFEHFRVPVASSEMTFSLSLKDPALEWAGTNLNTLFAQRSNAWRPGFLRMLRDVMRFNREASTWITRDAGIAPRPECSLAAFLAERNYSVEVRDWYLVPMAAAIWSCPSRDVLDFPFATFARFFFNHGLLRLRNRPQWYTVAGGARQYVDRLSKDIGDLRPSTEVRSVVRDDSGVTLTSAGRQPNAPTHTERYDALVLGCHSDQALRILGTSATAEERTVLGAIPYQPNRAILHTDASLLPANRRLWSAWNYTAGSPTPDGRPVSVHYLLNKLQPLPFSTPLIVSLNPYREPRAETWIDQVDFEHPQFGSATPAAQARLPRLQGTQRTWYCGAWTRYGFHEDGLESALAVARQFGIAAPWQSEVEASPKPGGEQ